MSRLSSNILFNILGQLVLALLAYASVKYIYTGLGADALGIIFFVNMSASIASAVLEMGVCSTTVREVSVYYGKDSNYIKRLLQTFSCYFWCGSLLLALVVYWSTPFLASKWIKLQELELGSAIEVCRAMGIGLIIAIPKSLYASAFRGIGRMDYTNIIDVGFGCIQQGGTIILVVSQSSLVMVAYWIGIVSFAQLVVYFHCLSRFFPRSAFIPMVHRDVVKRTFRFSGGMALMSLATMIHMQIDKILISKLLPVGLLGYYSIAYSTVQKGTIFHSSVVTAVFPHFSSLYSAGDHVAFLKEYRKYQDLLCYGAVPIFFSIPFVIVPLFTFLTREDVAIQLLVPASLLALGFYMSATINIPYFAVLASGRSEYAARLGVYALFIVVPGSCLAVYYLGMVGAGCSFVIYHLFAYIYFIPIACAEVIGIETSAWFRHILRIAFLISGTYGAIWMLMVWNSDFAIGRLFAAYTIATASFLIIAYRLIGSELKAESRKLIRGLFGR